MSILNNHSKKLTFLTLWSTMLLGFLDAYSYMYNNGTFISAQTGNLLAFGIKLSQGNFYGLLDNLPIIIGFALGCFISPHLIKKIADKKMKLLYFWNITVTTMLILTIFQPIISSYCDLILLSSLAGYLLSVFRMMRKTNLNNGIMTGNLKNMYTSLYNRIIKNKNEDLCVFFDYLIIIFLFVFGSFLGGTIAPLGKQESLIIASILSLIPYIFLLHGDKSQL